MSNQIEQIRAEIKRLVKHNAEHPKDEITADVYEYALQDVLEILDTIEAEEKGHPVKVNAIGNSGNETIAIIVDRDDCKILHDGGIDERLVEELKEAAEQLNRRRDKVFAFEKIELPEIKPFVDDIARKEAKERHQQFKYALIHSNRRK